MKYTLAINLNDTIHTFILDKHDCFSIEIPNEFLIYVFKEHDHRYKFKAFFYKSKSLYSYIYCSTKKLLFVEIQNLLKREMYNVIQF